jgi:microcystin-dependent protein
MTVPLLKVDDPTMQYNLDQIARALPGNAVTTSAYAQVGDVKMTARSTAPTGWLLCDGSAISRTTFASLFAAIGTTYGVGDGATTFNLPNMSGRVPVGVGTATGAAGATAHTLGQKAGEETHQLSVAELAAHAHQERSKVANGGGTVMFDFTPSDNNVQNVGPTTGNTGGDAPHNTMQPYLGLNFVIKA